MLLCGAAIRCRQWGSTPLARACTLCAVCMGHGRLQEPCGKLPCAGEWLRAPNGTSLVLHDRPDGAPRCGRCAGIIKHTSSAWLAWPQPSGAHDLVYANERQHDTTLGARRGGKEEGSAPRHGTRRLPGRVAHARTRRALAPPRPLPQYMGRKRGRGEGGNRGHNIRRGRWHRRAAAPRLP